MEKQQSLDRIKELSRRICIIQHERRILEQDSDDPEVRKKQAQILRRFVALLPDDE